MYRERLGNVGPEGITEYVLPRRRVRNADLVLPIHSHSLSLSVLNMPYPFNQ